ncbi:hypothetical protein JCM33374_g4586 [Metschnikowia sp. JCM 33374]|nr:hypothetical protein JCM33374_g4586 [Metschnikowia sp. JCM 33374]
MAPHMKGLHQFILDLRNASDASEELKRINVEINNIRAKYASSSLDSYSKRKYMSKLLYIHLSGLANETRFGCDHALTLLSSSVYSEKSLGYLAVSILFTNEFSSGPMFLHHLLSKTHQYLVRDLSANSEDTNLLALQFIASTFNCSASAAAGVSVEESGVFSSSQNGAIPEKWVQILEMVYGLCVSPISVPTVKMRALVALLVMAKTAPSLLLANDNWFPRLLSLLDERDLGVVTSAAPLVTFLTTLKPKYAKSLVPQVASLLYSLLVEETCPASYLYYEVQAPWLVVKLLQLVEHLFLVPAGPGPANAGLDVSKLDAESLSRLQSVVSRAIQNASRPVQGQSDRNARSAILFQAVSIAPFLDASPEAIHGAIHALASLLSASETNTRYLVLDALIKLCVRSRHNAVAVFKEYLPQIIGALQDRDVSVRKKALDLLFTVCDANTYTQITTCLLDYFPHAEIALKSDISIKIAVLAERFATDSIWYVSTMLRLLSIGGQSSRTSAGADGTSHAGEVWERIIQIIVNNEDVQKMATKYVINLLRKPESEPPENILKVAAFIIGEFGYKLVENVDDSTSQFGLSNQFRILSSAYSASGVSARPLIMNAFLKFIMRFPQADFVPDVLDLFDAETSSLDLEIQTRAHEYLRIATLLTGGNEADISFAHSLVQPIPPFESKENKLISQLVSGTQKPSRSAITAVSEESLDTDPFGDSIPQADIPQLSPNWYEGYHRMLQFDVGIFYEDQLVKLTYRIFRDGPTLRIVFTIINNAAKTADASITAFTVHDIHTHGSSNYVVEMVKVPESKIPQKTTMELEVKVRDIFGNKNGPVLAMNYKCSGSFNTLTLKIPVVIIKTLSGTSMNSIDEFKRRWLQIGELIGLERGEKRGLVAAAHRRNTSTVVKMLQRLGFAIIQSTPDDPNSNILVMGAGILRMVKSNCGVLVTVKSISPNSNDFDVIVRSTGVQVPAIVHDTIRELFDLKH